jgi:sugar/nucleoside kinase (ribokinase family)
MNIPHATPSGADLRGVLRFWEALPGTLPPVVAGFDGFVDEMISVVAQRASLDHFTPVPDIATFAGLAAAAAGQSSLREIVVNAVHPGGCAVNLGDGLAALGVPVDCYATLGEPPHPAFAETTARFRQTVSWGREPGRTLAFEFADGKLMYSAVRQLADFTPQEVARRLEDGAYLDSCRGAAIIALTDWTLYPHMTAVWRFLQQEVYAKLAHRPHFFVDLVDPSGRSPDDIRQMLQTLPLLEACGPLTLGLNGKEANILGGLLGMEVAESAPACAALAGALAGSLRISTVAIHERRFAVAHAGGMSWSLDGPFCERPLKSTGAGDRFNAGYCAGLAAGTDPGACLALGCAASGFFVRHARSASCAELAEFLRLWEANRLPQQTPPPGLSPANTH